MMNQASSLFVLPTGLRKQTVLHVLQDNITHNTLQLLLFSDKTWRMLVSTYDMMFQSNKNCQSTGLCRHWRSVTHNTSEYLIDQIHTCNEINARYQPCAVFCLGASGFKHTGHRLFGTDWETQTYGEGAQIHWAVKTVLKDYLSPNVLIYSSSQIKTVKVFHYYSCYSENPTGAAAKCSVAQ